jgi:archaellum biogenesis ATPase FlaH
MMRINNLPISGVKTGKEIIDLNIESVPMLLDPLFPKYGVVSFAGSSDLGKSYFLLQLSSEIINGAQEFLKFKLNTTHRSVIYLSTEDDEYGLCPRLLKLSKRSRDVALYTNLRVILQSGDLITKIDKLLNMQPADAVIIDTFADVYGGDMVQSNKVRTYIQQFKDLAVEHKTLFIFNHHCSKKNDYRIPHKDNLLGSQGFESSMRSVIEFRQDFKQQGKRHLCIVKGNHIDDGYKTSSFELTYSFDDGFSSTGHRVKFEELVRSLEKVQPREDSIRDRIIELRGLGLSITKIAAVMKKEGHTVSRSKVGNICKENPPSIQKPKDNRMDGQAA